MAMRMMQYLALKCLCHSMGHK